MRELIVSEFISIDGVIEAPGGESGFKHTGWVLDTPPGPERGQYKLDEVMDAEALLLGRVTYEGFAAAWPERDGSFADKMNGMPKYVVSTTLSEPLEWDNSTLIRGDVPEAVAELKQGEGGAILVAGSRTLVQTLHGHGLVDEYRLMVFPVVLGSGLRLFGDGFDDKAGLVLADSRALDEGIAMLTYRRP